MGIGLFYILNTNATTPQSAARAKFWPAPVTAPLSVVDELEAELEEVADEEPPVSEGPDDADAAV